MDPKFKYQDALCLCIETTIIYNMLCSNQMNFYTYIVSTNHHFSTLLVYSNAQQNNRLCKHFLCKGSMAHFLIHCNNRLPYSVKALSIAAMSQTPLQQQAPSGSDGLEMCQIRIKVHVEALDCIQTIAIQC